MAATSVLSMRELRAKGRFDAEFFRPDYVKCEAAILKGRHDYLGNVARTIKRGVQPEYSDEGSVPVIRTVNVRELALSGTRQQFVSAEFCAANPKGNVGSGDIVITSTGVGTLGRVSYIDEVAEYFADGHIAYVRDVHGIDPLYLVTFLQSSIGRSLIDRRQRGSSGQMEVYTDDLASIPVPRLGDAEDRIAKLRKSAVEKMRIVPMAIAAAEAGLMEALRLDHLDLSPIRSYARPIKDLLAGRRFGAEYYMPCKQRALDALAKGPHKTLLDHAPNIRDLWQPEKAAKDAMVRNFDLGDALEPFLDDTQEPMRAVEVGSTKKRFKAGDVVVSRLRSYLREIAVVRTTGNVPAVGSAEFIVLRPTGTGLSAETILVYLRCPLVQTILKWSQDGSNHPRFDEDDLIALPVPDRLMDVSKKIEKHVHDAIVARQEATRLLEQAKRTVEEMIAGGDDKP